MARRSLSPDEETLWTALTRSVRPLRPVVERPVPPLPAWPAPARKGLTPPSFRTVAPPPAATPSAVLDSAWEKRIRGGTLAPEMTIDLHWHSLAAAHVRLDQALSAAIARNARVILVVTGKPPKNHAGDGSRRGAIRAEIGQWLASSPYAASVASVRIAHRRHGGDGALYIILRRKK